MEITTKQISNVEYGAKNDFGDSHETDSTISLAILALATEERSAETIWQEPTADEINAIYLYCVNNSDEEPSEMFWGESNLESAFRSVIG